MTLTGKQWSIEEHFAISRFPRSNIGGWYDIFLNGTLATTWASKLTGLRCRGATAKRLLIQNRRSRRLRQKIGDIEFGDHAIEFPPGQVLLDWYDFLFKGIQNEFASDKPVHVFVMARTNTSNSPTGRRQK